MLQLKMNSGCHSKAQKGQKPGESTHNLHKERTTIMSTFLIHFGPLLPVLAVSLAIPLVFMGAFVGIGRMRRQGQRTATQPMQVQQMVALHDLGDLQKSFDQQDLRGSATGHAYALSI
jgi:hypothetical protein